MPASPPVPWCMTTINVLIHEVLISLDVEGDLTEPGWIGRVRLPHGIKEGSPLGIDVAVRIEDGDLAAHQASAVLVEFDVNDFRLNGLTGFTAAADPKRQRISHRRTSDARAAASAWADHRDLAGRTGGRAKSRSVDRSAQVTTRMPHGRTS
jgi:hypothetical protein